MKKPQQSITKYAVNSMLAILFSFTSIVSANPIEYQGILGTPSGEVSGSVDGFSWFDNDAAGVDFWSFSVGSEGTNVNIRGTAESSNPDLAFTLYSGVTNADENEFVSDDDFGGMTFLSKADDEIIINSTYGDPAIFAITLPEGDYTIAIGGYDSVDIGPYNYNLTVTAVPLPATFWFMLTALMTTVRLRK